MPNLISSSRAKQIFSATTLEQRTEAKRLGLADRILKKIFNFSYLKDKEKVLELVDQITHDTDKTDFKNVEQKLKAFNTLGDLLGKKNKSQLRAKFYDVSTASIDNKFINDHDKSEIILDIAGVEVSVLCEKAHLNTHRPEIRDFFNSMKGTDTTDQSSTKVSPARTMVTNIGTEMLDSVEDLYTAIHATGVEKKADTNGGSVQKQSGRDFIISSRNLNDKIRQFSSKNFLEKINTSSELKDIKVEMKNLLDSIENITTPKPLSTLCVIGELKVIQTNLNNMKKSINDDLHSQHHSIQNFRELSTCISKISQLSKQIDIHLNQITSSLGEYSEYKIDTLKNKEKQHTYLEDLKSIARQTRHERETEGNSLPIQFVRDHGRCAFEFKNGDYEKNFKIDRESEGIGLHLDQVDEIFEHLDFSSNRLKTKNEVIYFITSFFTQTVIADQANELVNDIISDFDDEEMSWTLSQKEGKPADNIISTTKNSDGSISINWQHRKPDVVLHDMAFDNRVKSRDEYAGSDMGLTCNFVSDFNFTISPQLEFSIQERSNKITIEPMPNKTESSQ